MYIQAFRLSLVLLKHCVGQLILERKLFACKDHSLLGAHIGVTALLSLEVQPSGSCPGTVDVS